uniref:Uncharacterized protein n=1 Tax=Vitis vinifera TaxID=29760 RepID=F6HVZ1_VITVI
MENGEGTKNGKQNKK